MMWDVAQLYANNGLLQEVVNGLSGSNQSRPNQTSASTVTPVLSLKSSSAPLGGAVIPQWGQCGGQGHIGSTQCQPPYKCIFYSQWWSDCR